ncbi:helix-turn-helix domain-containing protein [Streptomyces apocyni]|uniref:hypothetical protein n=1 Tax=Streptomyces apocyni TaxID=2654677 RepID=UPI0012EA90D5|nr:hypothetical protein [Streptomyces apocyni]
MAGFAYHKVFGKVAEAIIVALTATEIAFYVLGAVEDFVRVLAAKGLISRTSEDLRRAFVQLHRRARAAYNSARDSLDHFFDGVADGFAAFTRRAAW